VRPTAPRVAPVFFLLPLCATSTFRYLKPGGLIFPNKATMYVAAIEDEEYKHNKIECEWGGRAGTLLRLNGV